MPALQALFFDIDDTLCATTQFALRARRNAVRAMIAAGVEADEELVFRELVEVIAEFSSNYEHHYDKLLLRLPPASLAHVNRALVVAAGVAAYHDTKFRELSPYPGVIELFGELRALGVRLGIITHGWTTKQAEKLVRLGLVPLLDRDSIFISDQIGIAKPNPKLYATALRAHDLDPVRCVYVGDNPKNDVAPPKSLGMVTVLARLNAEPTDSERRLSEAETPDFVIHSFQDLRELLRAHFGLELARGSAG
jgi:putative hydrolase of the HAD superfamily